MRAFFRVPNSVFNLRISSSEKLVLIYLYRLQHNGIAFPSLTTMSRNCQLHRDTIIELTKQLEGLGLISVERVTGKVNHYTILDQSDSPTNQ